MPISVVITQPTATGISILSLLSPKLTYLLKRLTLNPLSIFFTKVPNTLAIKIPNTKIITATIILGANSKILVIIPLIGFDTDFIFN